MTCVVRESSIDTILSGIGVAREAAIAGDVKRPAAVSGLVKEASCDSILNVNHLFHVSASLVNEIPTLPFQCPRAGHNCVF
jgi:hypothetical protein